MVEQPIVSRERVGSDFIPVPRFGIIQRGVRVIDDYARLGQNLTISMSETIDVHRVDEVAGTAKEWLEVSDAPLQLKGASVDLRSAYKQLAVRPSHRKFSVIAVWNPRAMRTDLRIANALGFGSSANVVNFNRCSRALEFILVQLFVIPICSYFDDFPMVALEQIAMELLEVGLEVFALLGWAVKNAT